MYEVLARPGTTFLLSHKRNLREMTYSNWLTDFLSKLFMKIDNRINQGFLFFCYFLFSKSPEYILCYVFFLITNAAFFQSDNFMHEGREFVDLWSNTCCECWRGKMCLKSPRSIAVRLLLVDFSVFRLKTCLIKIHRTKTNKQQSWRTLHALVMHTL